MEPLATFHEVKNLEVAKDKLASRRGQITKTKLKLAELKTKPLDSISPATLQSLLAKLKKDLLLHETIHQRFLNLLEKGETEASLIQEEENSAFLVLED